MSTVAADSFRVRPGIRWYRNEIPLRSRFVTYVPVLGPASGLILAVGILSNDLAILVMFLAIVGGMDAWAAWDDRQSLVREVGIAEPGVTLRRVSGDALIPWVNLVGIDPASRRVYLGLNCFTVRFIDDEKERAGAILSEDVGRMVVDAFRDWLENSEPPKTP